MRSAAYATSTGPKFAIMHVEPDAEDCRELASRGLRRHARGRIGQQRERLDASRRLRLRTVFSCENDDLGAPPDPAHPRTTRVATWVALAGGLPSELRVGGAVSQRPGYTRSARVGSQIELQSVRLLSWQNERGAGNMR